MSNPQFFAGGQAAQSSLLSGSAFTSRFDKEIELGVEVKKAIEADTPKAALRAISAMWMTKYLEFVDALVACSDD